MAKAMHEAGPNLATVEVSHGPRRATSSFRLSLKGHVVFVVGAARGYQGGTLAEMQA
jgi:hypothetical protein